MIYPHRALLSLCIGSVCPPVSPLTGVFRVCVCRQALLAWVSDHGGEVTAAAAAAAATELAAGSHVSRPIQQVGATRARPTAYSVL